MKSFLDKHECHAARDIPMAIGEHKTDTQHFNVLAIIDLFKDKYN